MDAPIWTPSPERIAQANLSRFIEYVKRHYSPDIFAAPAGNPDVGESNRTAGSKNPPSPPLQKGGKEEFDPPFAKGDWGDFYSRRYDRFRLHQDFPQTL